MAMIRKLYLELAGNFEEDGLFGSEGQLWIGTEKRRCVLTGLVGALYGLAEITELIRPFTS